MSESEEEQLSDSLIPEDAITDFILYLLSVRKFKKMLKIG